MIDKNFLEKMSNLLIGVRIMRTAVNLSMVHTYFEAGRMIVEKKQNKNKNTSKFKKICEYLSIHKMPEMPEKAGYTGI